MEGARRREAGLMTRRDFELIAAAVRKASENGLTDHVATALARALAGTNPRFDRARFIAACNGGDEIR